MTRLVLCSGQGAQHPAMFARLSTHVAARPILAAASDQLGVDLASEDDVAGLDLSGNRTAQILITAHCLAAAAALGIDAIDLCVGYSVGEISACACAGAYDFKTALYLVERRAAMMDSADTGTPQGMLAVVGIDRKRIADIAREAGAEIAIINGPDHVVLGGPAHVIEALEQSLSRHGSQNIRRLPVRVASHTRFIASAAPAFSAIVAEIDWKTPRVPVLSGLDGRPVRTLADARDALSRQLWQTIDFERCLQSAAEQGATVALEIGPGRALVRMSEDILPVMPARAFEDFRSPEGAAEWMRARM